MKKLEIKGDNKIPTVVFNPDGKLLIEGRAIPERPDDLFRTLNEWVESAEIENVEMTVRLEYFNTIVSKHLAYMFQKMVENRKIGKIKVYWYYEEGDDDSYDSGLLYKNKFSEIEFEFFVFQ